MSEVKHKFNFFQYQTNPFFKINRMWDHYDDTRDEQSEEADTFINLTQDISNKNLYDSYKSFFYRYQDYNQITR
jgi:hypothetical protein